MLTTIGEFCKMFDNIDLVPVYHEIIKRYSKYLDYGKNMRLSELYIYKNSKGELQTMEVYDIFQPDHNEWSYEVKIHASNLFPSVSDNDSLKKWFLSLSMKEHYLATGIFPRVIDLKSLEEGFMILSRYPIVNPRKKMEPIRMLFNEFLNSDDALVSYSEFIDFIRDAKEAGFLKIEQIGGEYIVMVRDKDVFFEDIHSLCEFEKVRRVYSPHRA